MRIRPSATTSLTALAVALLLSLPATAGSPGTTTSPGGWQRSPSQGFSVPAGELCDGPLRSETLLDQVWVRTTRTFADGSPRRQEYSGPLVVRLVDERTGAAVRRDLSGRAVATYRRDGGYDLAISGPAAVGFHEGDGLPRGYYVLDGYHVVRFAADGTRTVVVDRGTERDVCAALGS